MQINNTFSSVRGEIRKLFMAASEANDLLHFGRIAAVLEKMRNTCMLIIWCNNQETSLALAQYLKGRGHRSASMAVGVVGQKLPTKRRCLMLLPDVDNEFCSIWARDPYLCLPFSARQIVLVPSLNAKLDDGKWAQKYLSRLYFDDGTTYSLHPVNFSAAGGNVLFDKDFILVGARQLRAAASVSSHQNAEKALLDLFNLGKTSPFQKVIAVGEHTLNEPERLFHLDLYLSLTACVDPESGRYLLFLAHCKAAGNGANAELNNIVLGLNRYLDAVVEQLEGANFSVRRNPVPVVWSEAIDKVYMCAYNNCLTEVTDQTKTVWLPQASFGQENAPFGSDLRKAERRISKQWRALGFKVRWIAADFHSIMDDVGALHCITNELERQ